MENLKDLKDSILYLGCQEVQASLLVQAFMNSTGSKYQDLKCCIFHDQTTWQKVDRSSVPNNQAKELPCSPQQGRNKFLGLINYPKLKPQRTTNAEMKKGGKKGGRARWTNFKVVRDCQARVKRLEFPDRDPLVKHLLKLVSLDIIYLPRPAWLPSLWCSTKAFSHSACH